jgi:hypothetical protein
MKRSSMLIVFCLLFLASCQEKSSKKSSPSCTGNDYWAPGCPGSNQYGITGGVTGAQCQGSNYSFYPGCPGFCQTYPTHSSCQGGTTGTTTGGTTGGINPFPQYSSNPIYANWGVQYPGGTPAENCSQAVAPTGVTFTPYETRKATMSIQGKTFYSPASSVASQYMNTSSILKSVANARTLLETDSVLKVRFKPRPQPENTQSSPYCYIPSYTKMSSVAGYTKLQYSVVLVGTKANGTTEQEPIGTFTTDVNSCTPAIDLSSYTSLYPAGMYLIVQSVRSNQGTWPNNYAQYGFRDSNTFTDVRSMDCWVIDVEVAADGTKTFE